MLQVARHEGTIDCDVAWLKWYKARGNTHTCLLEALCLHCQSVGITFRAPRPRRSRAVQFYFRNADVWST
eukprot:15237682-Alexandrium_andersonii.AAC.1